MIPRLVSGCTLALAAVAAQTVFPIDALYVEGAERMPVEGVLRVAGLTIGQPAAPADFEAAAARLTATGLFHAVHYRYRPSPRQGYEVTFQVLEFEESKPVRLSVPDFDEAQLWEALQQCDPLLLQDMPASDGAAAYYARAIERFLAQQGRPERIVSTTTADLNRYRMVVVFRPEVLPKVTAVRFEGALSVPEEALAKVVRAQIVGTEYMEQSFNELLAYNVRPLFEERGRLNVRFSRPALVKSAGGVAVTVPVEEGPAYRLGPVTIRSAGVPVEELRQAAAFKIGELANWREISIAVSNLQRFLTRYGYLHAESRIERSLDDAAARADLIVWLTPGRKSVFGELRFSGIPDALAARLRHLWKLAPGAPMNLEYVGEYLSAVGADSGVRGLSRRGSRHLEFRPGTNIVDVLLEFRP